MVASNLPKFSPYDISYGSQFIYAFICLWVLYGVLRVGVKKVSVTDKL